MLASILSVVGVLLGVVLGSAMEEFRRRGTDRIKSQRLCRGALRLFITDVYKVQAVTRHEMLYGVLGPEEDPLPVSGYESNAETFASYLNGEHWKLIEGAQLGIKRLSGIRRDLVEEERSMSNAELEDYLRIRGFLDRVLEEVDAEDLSIYSNLLFE